MSAKERHVRLFRNGRNQAIRIPREFELEGDEAILRKEGDRLVVEPVRKGRILALLGTLDSIDEPFPDVDGDLPPLDDVILKSRCRPISSIPTSSLIWSATRLESPAHGLLA